MKDLKLIRTLQILIPDSCEQISLCGGPYNNFTALETFLRKTNSDEFRFCLGDLGGFGPFPDRTIELLKNSNVQCIQGNYDHSVGHGEPECGCGYLDPMDRHFAQVSFDYTMEKTSASHRPWLRELPEQIELSWRGKKIRLCHGSPVEMNEFVWETETSNEKIGKWLKDFQVDGFCGTHSGLPWIRQIQKEGFWMNVGVLGRPAHEGKQNVYYASLSWKGSELFPELHKLEYDFQKVVEAMRAEGLPEEFSQSLEKGLWTTCYNILPPDEKSVRSRS